MKPPMRLAAGLLLLLLSALSFPGHLAAQLRQGSAGAGAAGWAPISVGARAGVDSGVRNEVLGALLRIPILPSGGIELMPSVDVTFLRNLKEYQYNLEMVYVASGRARGVYAGGGVGFRNSIFGEDPDRSTVRTYSVVVGVRFVGASRFSPQLESRWVFVHELPVTPQQFTLGVAFALWGRTPRQ